MPACPRCARPLAVAGPHCLYCGTEVRQAAAPAATPVPDPPERTLVVVDVRAAPAEALAAALGLSRFEAARRAERDGYHLHRIAAPGAAEEEARRLEAAGLGAWLVPEAEARDAARPRPVRGGGWEEGTLTLEVDPNTLRIAGPELLLIVRGPIVREYQSVPKRQRVRAATLEGGHRVHLHLVEGGPPLEVDPGDFAFRGGAGSFGPSLIAVFGWVESLRAHAPLDDGFRRLLPALAPEASSKGALGVVEALRPSRRKGAALVLDNLAQFRFYSAWRAIVERRRRG